ncbi:hypothetical protein KKF84_07890 [Myxococcota bacterium]|nr:hypothetical protein [Myxococcota bacterium]MBU1535227.1 hypothetical protein [Myxococcota bacterium]
MSPINLTFVRFAEKPLKDARLEGRGALVSDDSTTSLSATRRPGLLAMLIGVIMAIVGVAIVVAITLYLEEKGIDLMRKRKGPLLIGMMGLFALMGGYVFGAWIAEKLFSSRVTVPLTPENLVSAKSQNGKTIEIIWKKGRTQLVTYVTPQSPDEFGAAMDALGNIQKM